MFSVAIDGPSGAGKSTLARRMAQELGFLYVDTGALYRTIALAVIRSGADTKDETAVQDVLPKIDVSLRHVNGEQRVFLDGEDVSDAIREEKVSMAASDVSAMPAVRAFLLDTQRKLAKENNVIMDGRDIGTVVLPDADVKIFLTASVEARAKRRYHQLLDKGMSADLETIKADVIQRDYNDTHREIAPLKQADDGVLVDTTDIDFEASLKKMLDVVEQTRPKKSKKKSRVLKPLAPLYIVLYCVVFAVAMLLVRIVYPIRTIGKQNLPKKKGFVLAPNHLFAIDPLYVLLARGFGKKMLVMSKDELFHISSLLNFFWNIAGAFPIERGTGDRHVLEEAMQEVKKGRGLLIFPEGTRSKDGNLGRLKSGAFVVAMEAGVDMIPSLIWYKAGSPKPFRRITVVFGEPMSMEQLGLEGEYSPKKLREAKKLFSAAIEALYINNKDKL